MVSTEFILAVANFEIIFTKIEINIDVSMFFICNAI
jgi:hypothetical protein